MTSMPPRDLDAAEAGHHKVGDHRIGRLLGQSVEELLGVVEDPVAEAAGRSEVDSQQLRVAEVVVQDVDFWYHECNTCRLELQLQARFSLPWRFTERVPRE